MSTHCQDPSLGVRYGTRGTPMGIMRVTCRRGPADCLRGRGGARRGDAPPASAPHAGLPGRALPAAGGCISHQRAHFSIQSTATHPVARTWRWPPPAARLSRSPPSGWCGPGRAPPLRHRTRGVSGAAGVMGQGRAGQGGSWHSRWLFRPLYVCIWGSVPAIAAAAARRCVRRLCL